MADAPAWLTRQAYAHRGLHDGSVPENSLAGFAAAIARGLGIECDLRVSADGRAMVFHDAELERLTGHAGRTSELSVGELTALRLRGSAEHIPTLRDMLSLVAGQVPLLLELKTNRHESVHRLCRAVRRDIDGYRGELAVMSFDPRIGNWFAQRLPDLPRGLVVSEEDARTLAGAIRRRLSLRHARPQFLAYDIRDLPSRFAARQAARGLALLTWTVRSAAQIETARAAGATPILEGAGVAAWDGFA
jgi:glycerophosphoryl diester phosphodiesterase